MADPDDHTHYLQEVNGVWMELYADAPVPDEFLDDPGDVTSFGTRTLHSLEDVPQLNSNPGAAVTIYLDFNGNYEANWWFYSNITTPAFDFDGDNTTFSDAEFERIERIWKRVSEDYSPFNVNVTTVEPPSFGNGQALRVAIGGSSADWYEPQGGLPAGGLAYVGSFTSSVPNVVYVFSSTETSAEIISHETGHAFGLSHQKSYDLNNNFAAEYNPGGGGWAPIMGLSYYEPVTTWYNGKSGSTTFQNDMQVIANVVGYRIDDHGNTTGNATLLAVNGNDLSGSGIIEMTSDVDVFSFTSSGGGVMLNVDPAELRPNLDIVLTLKNSSGSVLAIASPSGLAASISANLPAGQYFLEVKGIGTYGYTGQYTVTGSVNLPTNAAISGTLWHDLNADGVKQTYEPLLPGWQVFIDLDSDGMYDVGEASTTTDASGNYSFTGLVPGTYQVAEVMPTGWAQTTPIGPDAREQNNRFETAKILASGSQALTLSSHNEDDEDFFRWTATSSSSVQVKAFFQHDLADLDLKVYGVNQQMIGESVGTTDSESITFNAVAGQTYYFHVYSADWTQGQQYKLEITAGGVPPASPIPPSAAYGVNLVTVAAGQTAANTNFGNRLDYPAQISGKVWNDLDADGQQDAGEQPLSDWEVYLDLNRNGQLDQTTASASQTQSLGPFDNQTVFSSLLVSGTSGTLVDVNVTLNVTHGYVSDLSAFLISPAGTRVELLSRVGGGNQNLINLTIDDEALTSILNWSAPLANASYRPEGLLSDFDGEVANGTWQLELSDEVLNESGTLTSWSLNFTFGEQSTRSDSSGNYQFEVAPGDYRVQRTLPNPWLATWPTSPHGGYEVTVGAQQVLSGLNFGSRLAPLTVTAVDDQFTIAEDSSNNALTVLGNDSGSGLSITGFSQPAGGTLVNQGTQFTFSPTANFFGTTTFTYTVTDDSLNTAQAMVTVNVTAVNDPPQATSDTFTAGSEIPTQLSVLDNDTIAPDVGETLTIQAVGIGNHGGTISHNGTVINYKSAAGFLGSETFTYSIGDGSGSLSTATVTVNVAPDPAPVLSLGQHDGRPLDVVNVPILLNNAAGLQSADFVISYDTSLLDVSLPDVQLGSLTAGFNLNAVVNDAAGTITVTLTGVQPLGLGAGSVLTVDFHVAADAEAGESSQLTLSGLSLNQGTLAGATVAGSLDIVSPALQVVSMQVDGSAIHWTFNHAIDTTQLNLYEGVSTNDPADVLITEQTLGAVAGSLLWDPNLLQLTFIKTAGLLSPGNYSVTLFSRADGIVDSFGQMLDGNNDLTGGDNYTDTFSVPTFAGRVVSLPDFARGPGQMVELPTPAVSTGIPVRIDDATGVTQVSLTLSFDPDLLQITAAQVGAQLPGGWQIDTFNNATSGQVVLELSGPALSGSQVLASLTAEVPVTATLGSAHLLKFDSLLLNSGAIAVQGDAALGVVAFVGDATGNGSYSGLDAAYVSRVQFAIDSGFDAFPWIDPVIVADVTADSTLNATDANWIARKSIGLTQAEIPDIPPAVPAPEPGIGPRSVNLTLADYLGVAGENVLSTVTISDAAGLMAVELTVDYDPALLDVAQLLTGSLTSGFTLVSNVNEVAGTLTVTLFRAVAIPSGSGSLLQIEFAVAEEVHGTSQLLLTSSLNEDQIAVGNASGHIYVGAWQNPANVYDVNGDTEVDVVDALIVINELLQFGPRQLSLPPQVGEPPFFDVDGDGDLDVADALQLINFLLLGGSPLMAPAEVLEPAPLENPSRSETSSFELAATDAVYTELAESEETQVEGSVSSIDVDSPVTPVVVVPEVNTQEAHWAEWRWAASAGLLAEQTSRASEKGTFRKLLRN